MYFSIQTVDIEIFVSPKIFLSVRISGFPNWKSSDPKL